MFKVRRSDKDVLVISNKYVDELRNLSQEKLSLSRALYEVCSSDILPPGFYSINPVAK